MSSAIPPRDLTPVLFSSVSRAPARRARGEGDAARTLQKGKERNRITGLSLRSQMTIFFTCTGELYTRNGDSGQPIKTSKDMMHSPKPHQMCTAWQRTNKKTT